MPHIFSNPNLYIQMHPSNLMYTPSFSLCRGKFGGVLIWRCFDLADLQTWWLGRMLVELNLDGL